MKYHLKFIPELLSILGQMEPEKTTLMKCIMEY